ncbi:MAG: hypothetical protein HYU03_07545 [Thaumarchaeota archaeon]|nr:hypothetical protein [Nitrososphaerota archaeon]
MNSPWRKIALASLMVLLLVAWGLAFAAPALIGQRGDGSNLEDDLVTSSNKFHRGISPAAASGPESNQWSQFGPATVSSGSTTYSGRTTAIVVNASNALNLYIGASQGGVWKSTDGGVTWSPLTDFQPSLAVGTLVLSADQKTIFVGTGDPNHFVDSYYGTGVLKSSDGGKTWSVLGSLVFSRSSISGIVISQSNPNRMLVSTTWAVCCKQTATVVNPSGVGIFLSTDGGNTWSQTLSSPTNYGVASLVADPNDPSTFYAGDFAGTVWRSVDGGASWSAFLTGPSPYRPGRVAIATTPALSGQLFVAFTGGNAGLVQLERYFLGNASTFYLPPPPAPPSYSDACARQCDNDLVVAIDPSDWRTMYFGALDLYRSTDGGKTWTDLTGTGSTHPGQHALAISPATSSTVFLGNDGGVWKSSNKGTTWSSLNNGLATLLFNTIALGPSGTYLAGTKDNGCTQYAGGAGWNQLLGGDGGWMGYEANNTSIMYCAQPKLSFQKSMDGGHTWRSKSVGLNTVDPAVYYVPVVQYPNQSQGIVIATDRIYNGSSGISNWTKLAKYNNVTAWSQVTGNLGGGAISALAVAPSNRTVWWLGDTDGNIRISATSLKIGSVYQQPAANWQLRDTENGVITGIAVNASNRYQAYVSVSELGVIKLTRISTNYTTITSRTCTETGCYTITSTSSITPVITWKVLTLPQPKYTINVIRIDPATNYIYAGTDIGVYYSSDAGDTWNVAGVGLPNVPVYDMMINSNTLIVATHGRGVWSLPLLSSVTFTVSYSVQGGGSGYSAPALTYVSVGQQKNTTLSSTATPLVLDYGSSWSLTNPLSGATNTHRFATSQAASGTALSSQTIKFVYYNQYFLMFNYTLVGGGSGFTPPAVQFYQFGSSTSANAGSSAWADAATTYTYPTTLLGSSASERWTTGTPTGTVTNSVPLFPNFFHQYLVNLSYILVGGGGPTPPTILATALGSSFTESVTPNPTPYWLDANGPYSVTNPLQGSTRTERWHTFSATGSISSSGPFVLTYYHQYPLTVKGANIGEQWFTVGRVANFNITGGYDRVGGTGSRLVSYKVDGGGNTTVPLTASVVTIGVPMGSPHTLTLNSVKQYQVNLQGLTAQAVNSTTPPTIPGDNYWYDSGTEVRIVLNTVWNQTSDSRARLSGYSVNGGDVTPVASLQPVTVISISAITGPYSISARVSPQYLLDSSSGSLASVTTPSIKGDANWYDQSSSITATYNYAWNNQGNQSRLSATGYSIGDANQTLPRSGKGTFKVSFKITEPTKIAIDSVSQYLLEVSEGPAVSVSAPSPTGDGYYDSGSSVTVTTDYISNLSAGKSRDALTSYTLDGVTTNVARAEAGNFTTPPIEFKSSRALVFNWVKQFFVNFQFGDDSGSKRITPSSFEVKVNDQPAKIEGTKAWLDTGSKFTFLNIMWGGTNVSPTPGTAYEVTAPMNVVVKCQVFDVTIHAIDALGLPVTGATANIVLANGTQISARSGVNGEITLPLVPLGKFDATISNLGGSTRIAGDASTGSITEVRVPLSYYTIGLIGVAAAVAVASTLFLRRRRGRKQKTLSMP